MKIRKEVDFLERAIERFDASGNRFYREGNTMVLVNDRTIVRYQKLKKGAERL
ncbi:hypothetical protein ABB02_00104 [Clostridiaceae bacterium JG1575]|nr:hypothetical protein ABB02_00104 [Clostridiaceae bacterium JG1575]